MPKFELTADYSPTGDQAGSHCPTHRRSLAGRTGTNAAGRDRVR